MRRSRKRAGRDLSRRRLLVGAAGMASAAVLAIGMHLRQREQRAVFEKAGAQTLNSSVQESLFLQETAEETTQRAARIRIENTLISGLSREQAEKELKEKYSGALRIQKGEEVLELVNPVNTEIERLLKLAAERPNEDQNLAFDYVSMEKTVEDQVAALALKWNEKPEDSVVVSYDRDTGIYAYSKEQNGRRLNQEKLTGEIMEVLRDRSYQKLVEASFEEIPAKRTQAQAKEQYRVIGTFTTKLTSNTNRNKNVTLAAEAINGRILKPGEEFSFNAATGNRTSQKGYQPAGAYRNGVLIEEPGGGVCQVSTTLYHSVIRAGFRTTERNAHSFPPSYVEEGQDAMVSFDGYAGPDLKFINSSDAPVVLRASVKEQALKMSIVGLPVLEEGVTVDIRSEKIQDVEQPEPSYEENTELPYGTEKIIEEGGNGAVWKSFRVVTKNGEVMEETPLHNSSYKTRTRKIQRNTTLPLIEEAMEEEAAVEEAVEEKAAVEEPAEEEPAQEPVEEQTEPHL